MTKTDSIPRAVGRRKSAIATVRLTAGTGKFTVNSQPVSPKPLWLTPLTLVGVQDRFDVSVRVVGGGMSSRDQAVALAISRALIAHQNDFKSTLRKAGLVTVDARVKERKKPGLKRARKAPQWAKR